MGQGRAVLVFDGDCPVCRGAVDWVRRRSIPGAFEFLSCRAKEVAVRFPSISTEECLRAMQIVLPGGNVLAGERAVPEILRRTRYAWAASLFGIPGAGILSRVFYRWIAGHRHGISRLIFPGPPRAGT